MTDKVRFRSKCSFSAQNKNTAVIIKPRARNCPSRRVGARAFARSANTTVGRQETRIYRLVFCKGFLTRGNHFFRITMRTDSSVPRCIHTLKNRLSLPTPNFSKRNKCPDEDTGKNSVSPWTSPRIIPSQIFIFSLLTPFFSLY